MIYGGYADRIVVDEAFALHVPRKLDFAAVAPLLCAGITRYSPLRHWGVGPGKKVGVVSLGGLGHLALKFSRAFGAHTVQFTTSESKSADAIRLGAHEVVLTKQDGWSAKHADSFDFILDCVSAPHDVGPFLSMLKRDCTYCTVGLLDRPHASVGVRARRLVASASPRRPAEAFARRKKCSISAVSTTSSPTSSTTYGGLEAAWERVIRGDVKYRFVLDAKSLD